MGSSSSPNAETVRTWADAEEAALTAVRAKIRQLQAEEAALIVRIKALHDMLSTFTPSALVETRPIDGSATAPLVVGRVLTEEPGERFFKIAEGHRGSVGFRIRTQVAEVLAGR